MATLGIHVVRSIDLESLIEVLAHFSAEMCRRTILLEPYGSSCLIRYACTPEKVRKNILQKHQEPLTGQRFLNDVWAHNFVVEDIPAHTLTLHLCWKHICLVA